VAAAGFTGRISTRPGDMWNDPFPPADVHFYSNIFHDWPAEKCLFLSRKSFDSLTRGGRIILHEVLYNDQKTGPFAAASYSMIMLGWATGKQYSGRELSQMLENAGFRDIEIKPTFGFMSIVTGRKAT
jgi:O-methyltransferase domain